MVLSINIGYYEQNPKNLGIKGVDCKNLDGILDDYNHIKYLCDKMNYGLFPKSNKNMHGPNKR